MQLELIGDMELVYCNESLYRSKFLLVRPYGARKALLTGKAMGVSQVPG